jgi:serine phosphatase RsbU (regulator of sigma subunit)
MTSLFAPTVPRNAELRGWVIGLQDLERDGLDVAVRGRAGAATLRSGDRCFAIATGPGRWLLGLADAHGPGDEAADAARSVVGHLRARAAALLPGSGELPRLLGDTNAFVRRTLRGRLVSVVLVHADAAHHAVRVAVAGGVAPLVVGRSGDVVPLGDRGPVLGLVDAARWAETPPVRLAPGHVLAAVTDGVPDRARDDGSTFGVGRVAEILARHRADRPRGVVRAVLDACDAFAPGDPADRSALALRLR